jgi:hypothetical protein
VAPGNRCGEFLKSKCKDLIDSNSPDDEEIDTGHEESGRESANEGVVNDCGCPYESAAKPIIVFTPIAMTHVLESPQSYA